MPTEQTTSTKSATFDAAALAVATAAGAISLVTESGPYDWFAGIIGLTLLAVIWAYEWVRERTWQQRLALAMCSAFISMLVLGVVLEISYSGIELDGICPPTGLPYTFDCPVDGDSAVPEPFLLCFWPLLTAIYFIADVLLEGPRRRAP